MPRPKKSREPITLAFVNYAQEIPATYKVWIPGRKRPLIRKGKAWVIYS